VSLIEYLNNFERRKQVIIKNSKGNSIAITDLNEETFPRISSRDFNIVKGAVKLSRQNIRRVPSEDVFSIVYYAKIANIRFVMSVFNYGLKEAKDIVECAQEEVAKEEGYYDNH
jgi:hypothetical protein